MSRLPLTGVRVLELAGLAPGPFCGMLLADFGASVTRVDRVGGGAAIGDVDRLMRGKRSIAVDVRRPEGVDIVRRLSQAADVLIEPFRPGVMERLGLGPNELMAKNPRLIYARMTGFGQSGPLKDRAGHDINYLAISGVLSFLGRKGERPYAPINLLADFAGGGLICAWGIVLALFERTHSGQGQVIDANMVEGAAYVGSWLWKSQNLDVVWQNRGRRGENTLDGAFPLYDVYETADGEYMSVGALEPHFQAEFFKRIGEFADEREPPSMGMAFQEPERLRRLLTVRFRERTQAEWTRIFGDTDACVQPVLGVRAAATHAHNRARGTFGAASSACSVQDDAADNVEPSPAPRLMRTPAKASRDDCAIGEHTRAILETDLGYAPADVDRLIAANVVAVAPVASKL